MAATTIKLSTETRDRIKAFGGSTYEDTVVEALDLLEADRFWQAAEDALAARAQLDDASRQRLVAAEAQLDAAFDGIE